MTQWNSDWVHEGIAGEYADDISTYDPNIDPILSLRWDGSYKIRLLPTRSKDDFNVKYGQHWNVFPAPENQKFSVVSCPKFSLGRDCPICDGINRAISEKRISYEEVGGEKGIIVQRRVLNRVLLYDFVPSRDAKKPPKFTHFPLFKIIMLPAASLGTMLAEKLEDRDYGWKALFDPTEGKILKITRSMRNKPNIYTLDVMDKMPIPEEFLDVETWPDFRKALPITSTEELIEMVRINAGAIPDFIENHVMAIEVGRRVPRIGAGGPLGEEEVEESTQSKPSLAQKAKDRLKNLG